MGAMPDSVSAHWRLLRQDPLQAQAWFDLACEYATLGLPLQAGYCARQAVQLAPERRAQVAALAIEAWHDERHMLDTLAQPAPQQAAALARRCHEAVAACPGDWPSWLYLARLQELNPPDAGLPPPGHALSRAQACEPVAGESLHWLGRWRLAADDALGAVTAFSQLLDIRPVRCGSMLFLGEALLQVGNVAAAEKAFARASLSNNPDFLLHLAARVLGHNYWKEAIEILHKALGLKPDSVPHLVQLALIHQEVFNLAECRALAARIRALEPHNADAARIERAMHGRLGDANAHFAALRRDYAEGSTRLASTLAMTALYNDTLDAEAISALHRDMCRPIEAPHVARTAFANPRTRDRVLRIGYITGDLHRQHPVNLFMLPVLQRHDHARFDIHVYHTGAIHDDYTRLARACSDRWTSAQDFDDVLLARAIVDDGIDILVDLAGHSSTHRLGVFAMRAAPVQASFLGYPHSTGLAAMDWLIGDAVVSPAGHAHLFSEAIAQLPGSVFCWAPVDDYPLPLPRPLDAPLVFGSFNNVLKLSPTTIAMWAAILHAVPDAVLLLKSASLGDADVQARFTGLFAAHGIPAQRLQFRGPAGLDRMMQEYGDVDIALDPTPYNGGTTTLQALWMGVPVVSLEGGNFVSRMGASFLRTMGRPKWVARDQAGYVAAAVSLARRRRELRAGRAALRAAMQPLCDIDAYVRHFEALLRGIWASHCDGDGRRLLPADDVAALAASAASSSIKNKENT
jgi:predicted O-linked N-acetylglucosamine transferase (SPINDLY family)